MFKGKINDSVLKIYVKCMGDVKYTALASVAVGAVAVAVTVQDASATTDLITAGTSLVKSLTGKILGISSAAAVVGIGCGAFLKKFSLGKGDRIETGNKIMMNSIWGWVILNGAMGILTWVGSFMGVTPSAT
jgi:hypothetical protein